MFPKSDLESYFRVRLLASGSEERKTNILLGPFSVVDIAVLFELESPSKWVRDERVLPLVLTSLVEDHLTSDWLLV